MANWIFGKTFCEIRISGYIYIPEMWAFVQISPRGGIDRRADLKHQWGDPYRFDPGLL